MSKHLTLLSLVLSSMGLMACAADSEFEPSAENAETCMATLDCMWAGDYQTCSDGFQTNASVAAFDIMMCSGSLCKDECSHDDRSRCEACERFLCAEQYSACEIGDPNPMYGNLPMGRPFNTSSCYDILDDQIEFCEEGSDCNTDVYFSAAPEGRVSFARWLINGAVGCTEFCTGPNVNDNNCSACWAHERTGLTSCEPPGRTTTREASGSGSPDRCAGLSGQALCLCVTNNIGACS